MKAVPLSSSSLQGFINTMALTNVKIRIMASLHNHVGAGKGINICHYYGDKTLILQDFKGCALLDSGGGEDKLNELPLKEWSHRASEAGMDPTLATMIESVADTCQLVFPQVTKSG